MCRIGLLLPLLFAAACGGDQPGDDSGTSGTPTVDGLPGTTATPDDPTASAGILRLWWDDLGTDSEASYLALWADFYLSGTGAFATLITPADGLDTCALFDATDAVPVLGEGVEAGTLTVALDGEQLFAGDLAPTSYGVEGYAGAWDQPHWGATVSASLTAAAGSRGSTMLISVPSPRVRSDR